MSRNNHERPAGVPWHRSRSALAALVTAGLAVLISWPCWSDQKRNFVISRETRKPDEIKFLTESTNATSLSNKVDLLSFKNVFRSDATTAFLVRKDLLLTAAHSCDLNTKECLAGFDYRVRNSSDKLVVVKCQPHPCWTKKGEAFDVARCAVSAGVLNVNDLPMDQLAYSQKSDLAGAKLGSLGYGCQSPCNFPPGDGMSGVLNPGLLKGLPLNLQDKAPFSLLRAEPLEGCSKVCGGDSGGPVYRIEQSTAPGNKVYFFQKIVGVVAKSDVTNKQSYVTVLDGSFREWIENGKFTGSCQ